MQLPIVKPAPIVEQHSTAFRDLFNDHRQFQHFQNYLTGLMVLENKTFANISRCLLESSDPSNLSRFMGLSPWQSEKLNPRRLAYLMGQTKGHRLSAKESYLIVDDTLCEHVGTLFEYVDRHYNHSSNCYPLAHNLVTSHYLSGAVRFPVSLRLYRRYEEITRWPEFVEKHFPTQGIPKAKKERQRFHKQVDPTLLKDAEFQVLHESFQTKISLAIELIEEAIQQGVEFKTVLMDSWYLSPDIVSLLAEHKLDWVSLLKHNRKLEVNSFRLRDKHGQVVPLEGPHIKVEALVPLIPKSAYKPITIHQKTYWCFTFTVRVPSIGKVRLLISFENAQLTGSYAVLITNRTDASAAQILKQYLQRWPIETFYQDGKGHLGLDEYRMRSAKAIQNHWSLVFLAYSILHLACLPPSPIPGASLFKTIGEVCRQQTQALIEALILFAHERLLQGKEAAEVLNRLFSKQSKGVNRMA